MTRLLLSIIAGIAAASWAGMASAEAACFSVVAMLVSGLAAAGLVGGLVQESGTRVPRWLPLLALLATMSLLPTIDTTLLSQDASLHRAAGRMLAREDSLALADPALETQGVETRTALYAIGSFSTLRASHSRLPGGIVVPDDSAMVAYPSFAHLLSVWIAFAERIGGEGAIAWLGPLAALVSFWSIAWLGAAVAGPLAGVAAVVLLAVFLPQHYFGRFLMPEILAQALVWGGVVAVRESFASWKRTWVPALVAGLALGASTFARLEQLVVFLPALLVARAILPSGRRILPGVTWVVLCLMAVHALFHLWLVPTDYGNRIVKIPIELYAEGVYLVLAACGGDGYCAAPILTWVLPAIPVVTFVVLGWMVVRSELRQPGRGVRLASGLVAFGWVILLVIATGNSSFPVVRALFLYVPVLLWPPIAAGAGGFLSAGGLELALFVEGLDQVISGRVSPEQIWASRRLVPVVLPMLALMAVYAFRSSSRRVALGARACVLLAVLASLPAWSSLVGQSLQSGGAEVVRSIARAVPADSLLVLGRSLDSSHAAAAVWLGEGGARTYVLREDGIAGHQEAVRAMLAEEGSFYLLLGTLEGNPPDRVPVPPVFEGWNFDEVGRFPVEFDVLEPVLGRVPSLIAPRRGKWILLRSAGFETPNGAL